MSYSHYAVQSRAFSPDEWSAIREDAEAIFGEARKRKIPVDHLSSESSLTYLGPPGRRHSGQRTAFLLWCDPAEFLLGLRNDVAWEDGPNNRPSYVDYVEDRYVRGEEGLVFGFHTRWRIDNGVTQALLVRAKHHAPDAFALSSDGPVAEWDYEDGASVHLPGPSGLSFVRGLWPDEAEADLALLRADLERSDDE